MKTYIAKTFEIYSTLVETHAETKEKAKENIQKNQCTVISDMTYEVKLKNTIKIVEEIDE